MRQLSQAKSSPDTGADPPEACRSEGGQPKNFLRPCVLLLLAEHSSHGYDLLDRLKSFNVARDPGGLYRVLRSLERESLVASQWELSDVGPDRCLYTLTTAGRDVLSTWADTLDDTRRVLESYLFRFSTVVANEEGSAGAESLDLSSVSVTGRRSTWD